MKKLIKSRKIFEKSNLKLTKNSSSTLTVNQLKHMYGKWFAGIIADYRSTEPAERYSSLDEYLTKNAFFVTGTFHRRKMYMRKYNHGVAQSDATFEMDAFHNLYTGLAKTVLGNHWTRRSQAPAWPLAIVALDHPEAKFARSSGSQITNLHWHAIIVTRSTHRASYAAAIGDDQQLKVLRERTHMDSILSVPWDSTQGMDYAVKAFVKSTNSSTGSLDDLRIYPSPSLSNSIGWGYLRKYEQVTAEVKRLRAGLQRERLAEMNYEALYGQDPVAEGV
ncbi:hypothetical protein [Devosia sp. 2618]|uniref:hypothetical protein n=1 Tax=Devosia sp. 2618 TaxID=3156454 RepID=UPI003391109C